MSEGIWVYVFLIFCGMWMALIFVMIGVLIESVRSGKGDIKTLLGRHSDIPDSSGGAVYRCGCSVGTDNTEKHN